MSPHIIACILISCAALGFAIAALAVVLAVKCG